MVFVDNCYGEFVEDKEPCHVGADLIAGSLIKNPGGTVAKSGERIADENWLKFSDGSSFYVLLFIVRRVFQPIFSVLFAPGCGNLVAPSQQLCTVVRFRTPTTNSLFSFFSTSTVESRFIVAESHRLPFLFARLCVVVLSHPPLIRFVFSSPKGGTSRVDEASSGLRQTVSEPRGWQGGRPWVKTKTCIRYEKRLQRVQYCIVR